MKAKPSASIVIVTVDRADSLNRTLRSLGQLRYDNFEVLVVNGPSVDHTQEVIARYAKLVRPLVTPLRNISAARNVGIAHARADIVVFLDDDAIPEPDWLDHLIAAYADPDVVAVGGFLLDQTGYHYQCKYTLVNRYGDASKFENESEFTLGPEFLLSLTGANFSARRANLQAIGGFDEEYVYFLDETDVNIRMADRGWKAVVAPQAEIHHKPAPSLFRQNSPVPLTMYAQLRSKSYFCVTHNRARKPLFEILAYLADYIGKEREWKRDLYRNGLTDEGNVDRLIDEVERGVADGVCDAMRLSAPVGLSAQSLAEGQATAYKPFAFKLPARDRLRVCLFSREYPPNGQGGIGQWTKELATGLAALGHEVTVLSRCPHDTPNIDFVDGVWVHQIPWLTPSAEEVADFAPAPRSLVDYSWSLYREYLRIDGHRRFQVIGAPIADLEALVALRKCDIPVVVSLHTTYKLSLPFKPDWTGREDYLNGHVLPAIGYEGVILGEARHVVANSEAIVGDIESAHELKIDRAKLSVIPHGISDLRVGVVPAEPADGRIHLLFVGRLEARKGADLLLARLPPLLASNPNLVAHIVGEDRIVVGETTYRQSYEADNADRPDVLERTIFYGELPRAALLRRFAACDFFVAPSKYESFGLIFIEAMCFGKPVVAMRVGGAKEIVEEGVTGFLVAPERPDELAVHISTLVHDPELRARMGASARRAYETRFTARLMAERFVGYYWSVVAGRAEATPVRGGAQAVS